MSMLLAYKIGLGVVAVIAVAGGLAVWRMTEKNIPAAERFCRNQILGAILTLIALILCEPQAAAVAWPWLVKLLWPLVAVFTVLAYIYLDSLTSRAIGGLMILLAYYYVNFAFALHGWGAAGNTLLAMLMGAAGMAVSARPYYLRDWLRKCGKQSKVRVVTSLILWFYGSLSGLTLFMEMVKK